jgi:hypothetical protein
LAFFSTINVMIKVFHKLAQFWVTNVSFSPTFLAKIFF